MLTGESCALVLVLCSTLVLNVHKLILLSGELKIWKELEGSWVLEFHMQDCVGDLELTEILF